MEIYADYAVTTPVKPEIVGTVMTIYNSHYGNPSSIRTKGKGARKYLNESGRQIVQLLGMNTHEIIFTSGATESNNTAIKGIVKASEWLDNHIITPKIEHYSVLYVFEQLEREGSDITYLDVDDTDAIDLGQLEEAITDKTILVSIMFVNNEVDTVQQIYDIQNIIARTNVYFHVDAVQTIGHLDVKFDEFEIDAMSITAHKSGEPKGVGVLLVKDHTTLNYPQLGGGQELRRRAGAEDLVQIVGMAKALQLAEKNRDDNNIHLVNLKERFLVKLQERAIPFELNSSVTDATGRIINLYFPFVGVETMLALLDIAQIYVSSGSACTAGSTRPSHALDAMFEDEGWSNHSVRSSFNELTTENEINAIVAETHKIYFKLKEES